MHISKENLPFNTLLGRIQDNPILAIVNYKWEEIKKMDYTMECLENFIWREMCRFSWQSKGENCEGLKEKYDENEKIKYKMGV